MKVAYRSVHRAVHVHRRHHHAVGQLQALDPIRYEHRRNRAGAARFPPAVPALHPLEPAAVAQPQVLVADPLAAGQQRVVELLRREARIAGHVLEPLGGIARRRLQLDHFQPAAFLVFLKRLVGWRRHCSAPRPARWRPPAPAWCRNRSRSVRYALRRLPGSGCGSRHFPQWTRRKFSQAWPLMWPALLIRRWPSR